MNGSQASINLARRHWLRAAACGFGGVALHGMLADVAAAADGPLSARVPPVTPRAKRIIFLFMAGGPSQQDLFDPKPLIIKSHGTRIAVPPNPHHVTLGVDKYLALAPIAPVRPRGQSGMMMSDLLPHMAAMADDLCLMRSVRVDNEAHAPATLQFHTGASADVRPSMGSWISYGLGTENQNLPSFITIHPDSDVRTYGSAFLPAAHQGTPVNIPRTDSEAAIKYLQDPHTSADAQKRRLNFIQKMNGRLLDQYPADSQMQGTIESFELAFRMQAQTPKLLDLAGESPATLNLYGIGEKATDRQGRACLLARRFCEAGVRFVQVTVGGWDHHTNIRTDLPATCAAVDKPIAALIADLKSRGLLEDTLVLWSGEFGRTPWSQDLSGSSPIEKHGREHQPESFCAWMAGAGVRAGFTYGQTDDFGYLPVDGKIHLHDLHATMLHLLGVRHEQLTYRYAGRDFRLTDVYGKVVKEILA